MGMKKKKIGWGDWRIFPNKDFKEEALSLEFNELWLSLNNAASFRILIFYMVAELYRRNNHADFH